MIDLLNIFQNFETLSVSAYRKVKTHSMINENQNLSKSLNIDLKFHHKFFMHASHTTKIPVTNPYID